ncbi:hypothetical protein E5288_WYG005736 [Bos mutus]|uniref:Uncharacterized protein n=1 Tax=Bos mutus TaxID=72004 RepID=A0A6B0RZS9_9CETA|nr:hypothetical protein [Bos mutus]
MAPLSLTQQFLWSRWSELLTDLPMTPPSLRSSSPSFMPKVLALPFSNPKRRTGAGLVNKPFLQRGGELASLPEAAESQHRWAARSPDFLLCRCLIPPASRELVHKLPTREWCNPTASFNTHSNQIIFIKLFVGVRTALDDLFHPIVLRYGPGQMPELEHARTTKDFRTSHAKSVFMVNMVHGESIPFYANWLLRD